MNCFYGIVQIADSQTSIYTKFPSRNDNIHHSKLSTKMLKRESKKGGGGGGASYLVAYYRSRPKNMSATIVPLPCRWQEVKKGRNILLLLQIIISYICCALIICKYWKVWKGSKKSPYWTALLTLRKLGFLIVAFCAREEGYNLTPFYPFFIFQ